ncbi:MAG: SGNH/GDSL hydrolase family protein [Candidatus Komeilibacteria bacterium]|nr:SGNH/GDSL hydrolase family protein [Candidatus Komeilibacteria bacterium]
MRRKYLIIILIILALGIYLNRAYSYIYQKIGSANLPPVSRMGIYIIDNANAGQNITYVALGDSLTAGAGVEQYQQSYPYLLAQKIAEAKKSKVTLKILAIPGEKTADLINDLLPAAIADQPEVITLLIGVNDIHGFIFKADWQKKYEQILRELTQKTTAKIYLINLPEIGANNLLLPPYNYYFRAVTKKFNKVIKELASQYNLAYIDLATPTADLFKQPGAHYAADFFHPSAAGYALWAQIIYADLH